MVGSAIGDGGGIAAMMRRAMAAVAMVLLLCGPSQAQVGFSGYNDIATVAAHGRTDDVIRELQAGRSPSVRDDSGATALHYAAQLGDQRMANALLYYKAPVDARDQFGNTPLHWAAQRGSIPVMQLLLASRRQRRRAKQAGHDAADDGGESRPAAGGKAVGEGRCRSAARRFHRTDGDRLGRRQAGGRAIPAQRQVADYRAALSALRRGRSTWW